MPTSAASPPRRHGKCRKPSLPAPHRIEFIMDVPHDFDLPISSTEIRVVSEPTGRRILVPLLLFVATCATTYLAAGPIYALTLMLILTTHELGHFFQAVRYGVP